MKNFHGFTLVELIVVITILAILGTIGFMSLYRSNADTRDTVRISDTKIIARNISLKANSAEIGSLNNFLETSIPENTFLTGTIFSGASINSQYYEVGTPNPSTFGMHNFFDPLSGNKYPIALVQGEREVFYQVAAKLESGEAVIHGNYYMIDSTDLPGIIKSHNSSGAVIKGSSVYTPY